jgi:predicted GIY-YIG superfamily endonuclease
MAETYLPVEREEWAGMPATPLTDSAARAPAQPGVYFFAGADDTLLYVGKAANLRRRLADHARSQPRALGLRESARLGAVCTIRWEICADEEAALLREADLIVMLRPPFNASHTEQDPHRYLGVATDSSGLTSFDLLAAPGNPGQVYGCFPHLAKGAFSHAAKRTKAGYTALLRLLWAAQSKDVIAARDFFELAPRRVRRFRLRYGLPRGPVPADAMAELLGEEVRAAIAEPSTR